VPVPVLRSISAAALRTSAHCEFVPLTSLCARDVRYLGGRTSETSAAGVLRRRDTPGPLLTVVDAATLRTIDAFRHKRARDAKRESYLDLGDAGFARLVLDGVLEIETPAGFVWGPPAFDAVVERFDDAATSAIARGSRHAIAYGAACEGDEANDLSARLYCYGREPASARWRSTLPRRDSVADFLRFRDGLPGGDAVRRVWHAKHADRPDDGWFSWYRRDVLGKVGAQQSYKLYVSPAPDALRDAFSAIVATLTESDATTFKIGADVYGVLRPDKVVAYFATRTALKRAASALARALRGVAAHGVPFTCPIARDGLLSWGCDPPARSSSPERESWRLWITNRLADGLLRAKAQPARSISPETFALARVALDGVDPVSWTPLDVAWRRARAS